MSKQEELGLNEALLSVNKTGTYGGAIEVYHQTVECFGCLLNKLNPESFGPDVETYKVNTHYNSQLEIRKIRQTNTSTDTGSCRFDNLSLNSHAHYSISVSDAKNGSTSTSLDCKWQTLDSGDCLLCPFAILVSVIFGLMLLEWLLLRFVERSPGRRHSKLVSTNSAASESPSAANEQEGGQVEHGLAPIEQDLESSTKSNRLARVSQASIAPTSSRVRALDTFRGLTIAAMIFVNYGGAGYAIWDHKPWNGITLADFVFPFFVFSMGCSIALSVRSQLRRMQSLNGPNALLRLAGKIARRSLLLAFIGLCLNSQKVNYERADGLAQLRLTGVLQRFAFSYFNVAILYAIELTLVRWIKAQSLSQVPYLSRLLKIFFELMLACQCLGVYVYITYYFHYSDHCPPGYTGPGGLTEGGKYANCTGGAAAWLDQFVLGEKHLYQDNEVKHIFGTQTTHDPEGLLGYTTSVLLTLLGLQCGKIMSSNSTRPDKHRGRLMALGRWCIVLALSCPIASVIPINKRLWSLSFVLVTALCAILLIGLIYLALDVYWPDKRPSLLVRLLISAGKNSIFLYVAHSLVHTMLPWWFPISDPSSHLQLLIRLTWSLLVWLLIAHLMALKNLIIKV